MRQEPRSIKRPAMMLATDSTTVLLTQVAALATSKECPIAHPIMDEWIMLARALLDVITY